MKKIAILVIVAMYSVTNAAYTPKRSWVQTAAITYQNTITGTDAQVLYNKLGYYDMLINPGGTVKSTFRTLNPNGAVINYMKASSMYSPLSPFDELPAVTAWATSKGISAPYGFIYRPTANMTVQTTGADGLQHTASTTPGNYLNFFFWNTYRYALDMRDANFLGLYVHKIRTTAGVDEGVMEDEALGSTGGQGRVAMPGSQPVPLSTITQGGYADLGWGAMTEKQVSDSLSRYLTSWFYPRLSDSLTLLGKWIFKNYAAYFYFTDSASLFEPGDAPTSWNAQYMPNDQERQNYVGQKNINLLLGEYCGLTCGNFSRQWQYLGYMNQLVDSGCKAILWTGALYTQGTPYNYDIASYGKERAFRNQYCFYLMAAHPTLTWWLNVSNQAQTVMYPFDTIQQRGMVEYNIGTPLAKFTEPAPVNSVHHYLRLKRRFTNAVVLFTNNGPTGFTYDLTADTSTYHCTGFYEVQDNGTLSSTAVTSVTLLAVDGKIMVPNSGGTLPTGTIGISTSAIATEGGNLSFVVTLSQTQSGTTTFSYATSAGTATGNISCSGGTDFINALGTGNIPAGQLTASITITTCNDATYEQTENLTVTISNISPTTLVLTNATGTGTINDNDNPTQPNPPINWIVGGKVQIGGQTHLGGDD